MSKTTQRTKKDSVRAQYGLTDTTGKTESLAIQLVNTSEDMEDAQ